MRPEKFARLGDLCLKIGSGATPRGGKESYKGGSTSLIRSQNIHNDGFHLGGLVYIDDRQAAELRNVEVQPNDVLLNITGDSVARCCQVTAEVLPARVNQHVAIIRSNKSLIDPKFLRYVLVSSEYQSLLLTLASAGATRHALTKSMVEDLEIPLFPLDAQKKIGMFLGSIDDKILINQKMNGTLKAMAQALFQSWFVDFDPVRAKLDGIKSIGLDDATAKLFPAAFQDSALGHIPQGWEIRSLDKTADYLNGLALQKYPPSDGPTFPVIKIAQLRKGDVIGADRCNTELPQQYVVEDGDVLFSWSGSLEVDLWCGGTGALNQHLFKVTSQEFPKWFYYLWTLHHLDEFRLIAASKATTMGHIQRSHITDAKVVVPPRILLDAMTQTISPIIDQLIANKIQSRTLALLRDTLLPKLLSGDLSVENLQP
jgi:type I restriction enzyme S subunit